MHVHTTKLTEGSFFDFIDLLFTYGLDKTLDHFCTLSVFTLD